MRRRRPERRLACALDVATGSGNGALAAARLGCAAIGIDDVPTCPIGAAAARLTKASPCGSSRGTRHLVTFLRLCYGPVAQACAAFDPLRAVEAVAVPAAYLEAVALTR